MLSREIVGDSSWFPNSEWIPNLDDKIADLIADPSDGAEIAAATATAAATTAAAAAAAAVLGTGDRVLVSALQSRPELNGRIGQVVSIDSSTGRYHVQFGSGQPPLAMKRQNLALVEVPTAEGPVNSHHDQGKADDSHAHHA